jgi:ABC-type Na+ efflux pump permease subunit
MATKKGNQRNTRQSDLRRSMYSVSPLPRLVFQFAGDGQEDKMGFLIALVAMVLVFVLLLPLIGSIYYDTLATQKESKAQIERMEKLRKQLEEDRKQMHPKE